MLRTGCSADASHKQRGTQLADDRLSALPDVLLHTIMSSLKARQMVQTCVLSTRWRHLWRSVPCIDLDLKEFKDGGNSRAWSNLEDFTDSLLYHNNIDIALLDSFRLCCGSRYYSTDRWIRRGIKHSPSWRIKTLHLSAVSSVEHLARHISSGCPFLEDLELKDYRGKLDEITSLSLKKLVITGADDVFWNHWTITTPALASLCLSDIDILGVLNAPSLVNASIYLSRYEYDASNQVEFLGGLSNVTNLELSYFESIVVGDSSLKFPAFKNLKILCLCNCDLSDDFQTLALFLENSLNLESLTLRHCKFSKDWQRENKGSQVEEDVFLRCSVREPQAYRNHI